MTRKVRRLVILLGLGVTVVLIAAAVNAWPEIRVQWRLHELRSSPELLQDYLFRESGPEREAGEYFVRSDEGQRELLAMATRLLLHGDKKDAADASPRKRRNSPMDEMFMVIIGEWQVTGLSASGQCFVGARQTDARVGDTKWKRICQLLVPSDRGQELGEHFRGSAVVSTAVAAKDYLLELVSVEWSQRHGTPFRFVNPPKAGLRDELREIAERDPTVGVRIKFADLDVETPKRP
jgi:hypothetical protein